MRGSLGWAEVVTHEIMHAQYFLQKDFQKVVDDFWNDPTKISKQDKAAVAETLAPLYDVHNDPLLLKNEFQAYILMADAERNLLSTFVKRFRTPLMAAMNAARVVPIQVSTVLAQPSVNTPDRPTRPATDLGGSSKITLICVDRRSVGVSVDFDEAETFGVSNFYTGKWSPSENTFHVSERLEKSNYTVIGTDSMILKVKSVKDDRLEATYDAKTKKGKGTMTFADGSKMQLSCSP